MKILGVHVALIETASSVILEVSSCWLENICTIQHLNLVDF